MNHDRSNSDDERMSYENHCNYQDDDVLLSGLSQYCVRAMIVELLNVLLPSCAGGGTVPYDQGYDPGELRRA